MNVLISYRDQTVLNVCFICKAEHSNMGEAASSRWTLEELQILALCVYFSALEVAALLCAADRQSHDLLREGKQMHTFRFLKKGVSQNDNRHGFFYVVSMINRVQTLAVADDSEDDDSEDDEADESVNTRW